VNTALIAGPLLMCGGFVYNAIRHLFRDPKPKQPANEQPFDEVDARMAAAIAAEDHAGRRAALILARPNHREQQ